MFDSGLRSGVVAVVLILVGCQATPQVVEYDRSELEEIASGWSVDVALQKLREGLAVASCDDPTRGVVALEKLTVDTHGVKFDARIYDASGDFKRRDPFERSYTELRPRMYRIDDPDGPTKFFLCLTGERDSGAYPSIRNGSIWFSSQEAMRQCCVAITALKLQEQ